MENTVIAASPLDITVRGGDPRERDWLHEFKSYLGMGGIICEGQHIEAACKEIANLERQLFIALEDAKGARFCHAQDAVKLAWWNDTFQGMSRAEVLRLKAPNAGIHRAAEVRPVE